jgi:hypothetical protein
MIERLYYYNDYQKFSANDHTVEQNYHRNMRLRHNNALHCWGRVFGLEVSAPTATQITILPGMAIDGDGHEIVVESTAERGIAPTFPVGTSETLTEYPEGGTFYLAIAYNEESNSGSARTTEQYDVRLYRADEQEPWDDPTRILLAKLTLAKQDETLIIQPPVDTSVVTEAGAKIANNTIVESKLDAAARGKLVTNGNAHTHSGSDGAQISHKSLNLNDGTNPHKTTAADVGALPSQDGKTFQGELKITGAVAVDKQLAVNGNVGIGTANPQAKLQVLGGAIMPAVGNSPNAGIQFPSDPGGGGGDQAFIRYFVESGEKTKLLIGIENDAEDTIGLWQMWGERMTISNGGDIAINGKHAFRGSDDWLRLNQNGAFPSGVHTPGVFAPMSLNVGGAGNWGNPGAGNVWITGNVGIGGDIAINGKHAFRGNDPWLRLNQDGAFASGVHTPGVFAPMSLNVGGAGNWGNPGAGNVWITGNVGIGTANPQTKLHIVTAEGDELHGQQIEIAATQMRGLKDAYGILCTWDSDCLFIGQKNEGPDRKDAIIAFGDNAERDSLRFLFTGHPDDLMRISKSGVETEVLYVGKIDKQNLRKPFTAGHFEITGQGWKPGGGAWGDSSDRRLKKNIQPLNGALENLLKLHGRTYEWNEPEKHGNLTGIQMGLIAQEVENVFPEWIGTDSDGYKTLSIRGFEALTVEALRELKIICDELTQRIHRLRS